MRTLTLMSRTGLIEIDAEPPPKANMTQDSQQIFREYKNYRTIQILDDSHLASETWDTKVEPIRLERQAWIQKTFELMKEALKPKRCLSEIFTEAYYINPQTSRRGVPVESSCGGCPICRTTDQDPFQGGSPQPTYVWKNFEHYSIGNNLSSLINQERLVGIFYPSQIQHKDEKKIKRLIKFFIKEGIMNFVLPEKVKSILEKEKVFTFDEYQAFLMPKLPTLIYIDSENKNHYALSKSDLLKVVFMPENEADPTNANRLLKDVWQGKMFTINYLCGVLGL
jgi:hypothetical protein